MEPSPHLAQAVRDLYAAMSGGSADAVEAFYSLADGACFIGTDEAEFWTDSAQHNAGVRPFFEGATRTRWSPGDLLAQREGTVGWTVDRPRVQLADGSVLRPRVTLVWHTENGTWRIVHAHASTGD